MFFFLFDVFALSVASDSKDYRFNLTLEHGTAEEQLFKTYFNDNW